MCGIVAYYGAVNKQRFLAFEEMLLMDVIRGKDSVGVAAIFPDHVTIVKDIVLPHELMKYSDEYAALKKEVLAGGCLGLIGHNRWATRGKVTQENAHPFQHGNITMVHNGTAFTYRIPNNHKFDTDSEAICYYINEAGIKKMWSNVDGAMTLLYWNAETQTLNLAANGKRPMTFMFTENRDGVFFASEYWTWIAATTRCKLSMERIKADDGKDIDYYVPNDHTHYAFGVQDGRVVFASEKLDPFVYQYQSYTRTRCVNGVWENWENGEWVPEEPKKPAPLMRQDNVVNLPKFIHRRGFMPGLEVHTRHKKISRKDYKNYYVKCVSCGRDIESEYETSVIIDYKNAEAICGVCADTAERNNIDMHNFRYH